MRAQRQIRLYWASIRPRESLMMLGVPCLGILFGEPELNRALLVEGLFLLLAGLLIAGHIYTLNDLFGLPYDVHDRHKSERPLMAKQVRAKQIWVFSCLSGLVGYGILLVLEPELFFPTFSLTVLWILYSLPSGLKGYPVVTSAVNGLGAGVIPFLVGYLFATEWSLFGLLVSLYFGGIAAAGQMNREILDMEADSAANLRTTAVWLGRRRTYHASFGLFVASGVYLFGLALIYPELPLSMGVAALAVQVLHYWSYRGCLRSGLERGAILSYIKSYRLIYAVLGLTYVGLLLRRLLL